MILFSHISNTIQNLKANRTRNFLTILGVTIGATCIAFILALTNGAERLMTRDLANYQEGTILLRPSTASKTSAQGIDLVDRSWLNSVSLSSSDLNSLRALDSVKSATPILPFTANITTTKKVENQIVIGTSAEIFDSTKLELVKGQYLDNSIVENSAVLGEKLAMQLFSGKDCVGHTFTVRGRSFLIVGVIKASNAQAQNNDFDFDNSAIIRQEVARELTHQTAQIKQINILPKEGFSQADVLEQVKQALDTTRGDEADYQILTDNKAHSALDQRHAELSKTSLLIALIALLIGGIGVMNIMLVNVAEQTHEIGVRRSIGATTSDIGNQFLIQSIVISLIGGLAGLALSFGLSFLLRDILPFPAVYDWPLVANVLVVVSIIGVLAGIIPALKAATKNPIEALRRL